jgi:hypothetical protein
MTARDLIDQLRSLKSYLITLGRLNFVELLLIEQIDSKLLCAKSGFNLLHEANNIELFLVKFLNQKKGTIKWDDETRQAIHTCFKQNNLSELLRLKGQYEKNCFKELCMLKAAVRNDLLIYQLSPTLLNIASLLNWNGELMAPEPKALETLGAKNAKRVLFGPSTMQVDKVFNPTYDILNSPSPEFGETLEEIVPYFWSLSLREILASELCALSIVEYDNLPIQFYWDFAKQSWDEARHSKIYLGLSLSFFNDVETKLDEKSPIRRAVIAFNKGEAGLPVPKEKNMYEAIVNAELEERLILMNILTEAPAIARLTGKMKKGICSEYPEIKRVLEFDKIDETFHARIGSYWLKHLIPDSKIRGQKIEDTKILRGFLLLTSLSQYSKLNLPEMALNLQHKSNLQVKTDKMTA